jgi:hypothetical protein
VSEKEVALAGLRWVKRRLSVSSLYNYKRSKLSLLYVIYKCLCTLIVCQRTMLLIRRANLLTYNLVTYRTCRLTRLLIYRPTNSLLLIMQLPSTQPTLNRREYWSVRISKIATLILLTKISFIELWMLV